MSDLEALKSQAPKITLTAKAIEMAKQRVNDARSAADASEAEANAIGLRLGVKGGGCSGYYYVYDLATKVRPKRDLVYDFDGLKVVVDDRSLKLLSGSVLEWEQRLMGYGFKWTNPNATGDCGCGASFTV